MPYEPMSANDCEMKLRQSVTSLTEAQENLAKVRDAETDAEIMYRRAWRRAMLAAECPVPNRTDVTVAYRDAWVESRCEQEFDGWRTAQVATKTAEDHLRTVRDVTSTLQTLASGIRTAMTLAGSAMNGA